MKVNMSEWILMKLLMNNMGFVKSRYRRMNSGAMKVDNEFNVHERYWEIYVEKVGVGWGLS